MVSNSLDQVLMIQRWIPRLELAIVRPLLNMLRMLNRQPAPFIEPASDSCQSKKSQETTRNQSNCRL